MLFGVTTFQIFLAFFGPLKGLMGWTHARFIWYEYSFLFNLLSKQFQVVLLISTVIIIQWKLVLIGPSIWFLKS